MPTGSVPLAPEIDSSISAFLRKFVDYWIRQINRNMKQISHFVCVAACMLASILLHSCENDTTDGPYSEYCPWFPDYEITNGLKSVSVPPEGGEITVTTNIDGAVPLSFMASNVTVIGTNAAQFGFEWDEHSKVTKCDRTNLEANDSAFDWCNPRRHMLYTHEWLGIWQEPYVLHLYVQPNESTADRTIYVAPQIEPILYGFLTVVQKGAEQ